MNKNKKNRSKISVLSLTIGISCIGAILLSGIGYRLQWWHFSTGFTITEWAIYAAALGFILSLFGLYKTRPSGTLRGFTMNILAIILTLPILIFAYYWENSLTTYPPINDITTDINNPPSFWDTPNPVDYPGGKTAKLQDSAYPDLHSLELKKTTDQVFGQALSIVKNNNWEVITADKEEGQIEATASSLLYGFKDDIVIRIQSNNGGSKVDIRSHSRIGKIDRGANANRIRRFIKSLKS